MKTTFTIEHSLETVSIRLKKVMTATTKLMKVALTKKPQNLKKVTLNINSQLKIPIDWSSTSQPLN